MYSAAFDLGTTTIVGYLCDPVSGRIVRSVSEPSAQIECGLDVLSRASYKSASPENALRLSNLLGDQVVRMSSELLNDPDDGNDRAESDNGCTYYDRKEEDVRAVLVGNPVIMGSIAGYDFKKQRIDAVRIPGIGHYVGADALAASFTADSDRCGRNIIVVDIGTNTEIVFLNDHKKTATSAAAGPAMEGGNLHCGMRGEDGAIEYVSLTGTVTTNCDLIYKVVGGVHAKGICGSGYFSLLKTLLDVGAINNDGYLLSKDEALRANVPGRIASRIHENNDSDSADFKGRFLSLTDEICVLQEDIRNLQLAISGIRTGIEIAIRESGLTNSVIDNVYLAGAFGNKITIDSLIACGLLPKELNDKVIQVGNIAGLGACSFALDESKITDAIKLKNEVLTVSLAEHPDFGRLFLENMHF